MQTDRVRWTIRSGIGPIARLLPYTLPPAWKGQLIAVACAISAAALRFLIDPLVQDHLPVAVAYPFVIFASALGGALAGLSTMLLSMALSDYFWLLPRGSFKFTASAVIPLLAFSMFCGFSILMLSLFRRLLEDRIESEQRATVLSREMKHRVGNLLSMVQSISAQTVKSAASASDHNELLTARVQALAEAQRLVTEAPERPADLMMLLYSVLKPFPAERFRIAGAPVAVPAYLATSLALLFHELATNATKHGALSLPSGMVGVKWHTEKDRVWLQWQEFNGPPVTTPMRKGFGSRLLETAFPREQGEAQLLFRPEGILCSVTFGIGPCNPLS